ncbi:MAG: adenylate/guanylate cyclase domain-containing protein, partial [Magnetococcales bacterium]|nr:adenylate/guanylate cyclase domain-containing protein [Magnetococcales bacterium]
MVGNVGSSERIDYTAIGSTVNMAARAEGLNKFYGTQLLITETVRDSAGPRFICRTMDMVVAKGTTLPILVFELLGV